MRSSLAVRTPNRCRSAARVHNRSIHPVAPAGRCHGLPLAATVTGPNVDQYETRYLVRVGDRPRYVGTVSNKHFVPSVLHIGILLCPKGPSSPIVAFKARIGHWV